LAWLLTIGVTPLPYVVSDSKKELTTIALYGLFVILFVTWGFGLLHRIASPGSLDAIATFGDEIGRFRGHTGSADEDMVRLPIEKTCTGLRRCPSHPCHDRNFSAVTCLSRCVRKRIARSGVRTPFSSDDRAGRSSDVGLDFTRSRRRGVIPVSSIAANKSFCGDKVRTWSDRVYLVGLRTHACPRTYLRTNLTQERLPAHPSLLMAIGYSIVITSSAGF
jgi:hypothetical protein